MQRLFFHNRYDVNSIALLETLLPNPDVVIYDVYGKDCDNLPPGIKLVFLPYLVDKQITLETPPPYAVGIVALRFVCQDYLGNPVPDNLQFFVVVNGELHETRSEKGIIDVELECPNPAIIRLSIYNEGYGYMPFVTEIEVK